MLGSYNILTLRRNVGAQVWSTKDGLNAGIFRFIIFCPTLKENFCFITARKRSLGQGNMFTDVCLSTGGGGVWSGGVPGGDPPRRLLLRAVRILLECILVDFTKSHGRMNAENYTTKQIAKFFFCLSLYMSTRETITRLLSKKPMKWGRG